MLSFSAGRQYLDDNPNGAASDSCTISVRVTDDDTGSAPVTNSVVGWCIIWRP